MTNRIVIAKDLVEMPLWGMTQMVRVIPGTPMGISRLERLGRIPQSFTIGRKKFWSSAAVMAFLDEAIAGAVTKAAA